MSSHTSLKSFFSQVIIIGSGPAGYTAALYCARAGFTTAIVSGPLPGGQLTLTTHVDNYPGFANGIDGNALMEEMRQQNKNLGVIFYDDIITQITPPVSDIENPVKKSHLFHCHGENALYNAKAVIVATGANAKWLGIPGEETYAGRGVSTCATCDGFFFKNEHIVIVGGGNTALEEALFLANIAAKVIIIHRRDTLRGEYLLAQRVLNNPKIEIIWNTVVTEAKGNHVGLTHLCLQTTTADSVTETLFPCKGLFVAIGHKPNTEILKNLPIPLDEYGYVDTPNSITPVPGLFVAGDIRDSVYRQAVTAAAEGCMAALNAQKFLAK